MKLSAFSAKKWIFLLLAFLVPFIGILFVMLVTQSAPFGTNSFLYSDMYHQYYPFFLEYRRALLSGDSLLYSWNVGMGLDYLGLISYYLASPLYLLSVLLPESWLLGYFSLLMPLKLGFAGLFFAIFLVRSFEKNDFSVPIFSAFYALCAWALGYMWNIMWLDTFALLPLVALGTISLLKSRRFVLYTSTLFFSVFANYYIGFFACIFVLLIFICYEISQWNGFNKFLKDLLLMALFSILAIGMTAILELPALSALQTTQSSVNTFPKEFRLNIADSHTWKGLLDAMRQVAGNMNGGLTPTFKEGLPNIYCGVGSTIFAFLFLTCREIKIRNKICSVVLLIFFILSFIIRQLDYIWHGFHFTNMIPYRFSFLYSFVVLVMAYRAYLYRENFKLWQILIATALSLGIFICGCRTEAFSSVVYNILLIILFFTILNASTRRLTIVDTQTQTAEVIPYHNSRHISLALCGVMLFEIILNLANFGNTFGGANISNYPLAGADTKAVIAYAEENTQNEPFYRMEVTHSQTLNDGALNGYYGISTFTSSANTDVTQFMRKLGYGAKKTYNRYCFEDSSPVSNLFLNLKYMIDRDSNYEDNTYFKTVYQSGNVKLLENQAYLPIGFLTNSELSNLDFTEGTNPFTFQNDLFRTATGVQPDVWKFIRGTNLKIKCQSDSLSTMPSSGYCSYDLTDKPADTIVYSYSIRQEGFACFYLNQSKRNPFSVWKNGEKLYSETYSLPQMLAIGDVAPGDVVEIKLSCSGGEQGSINIQAAAIDKVVFEKGYEVLADSTLTLDRFNNTKIDGHITCNRDALLYTSIPQNGNWVAYVDGQKVETVEIGNAMVGIPMTEGQHEVTLRYINSSFYTGAAISIVCLIIFALITYFIYRDKNHRIKGKYE